MSTTQTTTQRWPSVTSPTVTKVFQAKQSNIQTTVHFANRKAIGTYGKSNSPLESKPKWHNREYREGYMEAAIEQGVAWQIKINRKFRNLSQTELAQAIGTKQSSISRFEDPEYGAHSLEALKEIAKAFDCALSVKFISYGDLASESEHLAETDQYAVPYSLEMEQCADHDD